jgi:hypothetical protein
MTAEARHERGSTRFFISTAVSVLILLPSLAVGVSLLEDKLPLQPALKISCLILFLASINFGTAIMLEPYRRYLSKLSSAAIVSMVAVVFFYIVIEALQSYFKQMGYGVLIPFVVISEALIYTTIFTEKNIPLKCLLSLDSIALIFLYALGAADKFTMPF